MVSAMVWRPAVLAVVLSCGAAITLGAQCPDGSAPPCPGARVAAAPASVAVLYFDNLSRDSSDSYLADGLTEEIIARLAKVERLAVKSRYAVRRYRGRTDLDAATLGRTLSVAHFVNGSVERAGSRLRVRVELLRAVAGTRVWGETYDRPDSDALAIEDDIAQAVAAEVIGRLAPAERAVLIARPTRSSDAYDHYLRGNFYLSRRTGAADGRHALDEYQAALRADPGFAAAYGRLGLTYGIFANWPWPYPGLGTDSLLARGLVAANRAIALDSGSADGWLARGFLLIPIPADSVGYFVFRLIPALYSSSQACFPVPKGCVRLSRAALARALRIDPRNAETWYQYGRLQLVAGHITDADSLLRHSLELDPDRAVSAWLLSLCDLLQGRPQEALRFADSSITLGRRDISILTTRLQARIGVGDLAGAQADLDVIAGLLGAPAARDTIAELGYRVLQIDVLASRGDTAATRRAVDTLRQRFPVDSARSRETAIWLAAALSAGGAGEQSLAVLQRVRMTPVTWQALHNSMFDPIRDDPRFQRLLSDADALRAATDQED